MTAHPSHDVHDDSALAQRLERRCGVIREALRRGSAARGGFMAHFIRFSPARERTLRAELSHYERKLRWMGDDLVEPVACHPGVKQRVSEFRDRHEAGYVAVGRCLAVLYFVGAIGLLVASVVISGTYPWS